MDGWMDDLQLMLKRMLDTVCQNEVEIDLSLNTRKKLRNMVQICKYALTIHDLKIISSFFFLVTQSVKL